MKKVAILQTNYIRWKRCFEMNTTVDLGGRDVFMFDYGGGDGSIAIKVAQELLNLGASSANVALIDHKLNKKYLQIKL